MSGKSLLAVVGLSLLVGCSTAAPGSRATAELKDKDGKIVGHAMLHEQSDGVLIQVDTQGLSAGLHGIHVHAVGKCEGPAFASAGGHFNPANKKHGLKNPDGAHGGDLPNMLVAKDGKGRFEALTDAITLHSGAQSVFDADGSAIVVHAGADDNMSDPAGNSGDRVACGIIVAQ